MNTINKNNIFTEFPDEIDENLIWLQEILGRIAHLSNNELSESIKTVKDFYCKKTLKQILAGRLNK